MPRVCRCTVHNFIEVDLKSACKYGTRLTMSLRLSGRTVYLRKSLGTSAGILDISATMWLLVVFPAAEPPRKDGKTVASWFSLRRRKQDLLIRSLNQVGNRLPLCPMTTDKTIHRKSNECASGSKANQPFGGTVWGQPRREN